MAVAFTPPLRSAGTGAVAAVVLIGAFALGSSRGSGSPGTAGHSGGQPAAAGARITVTGTGMVSGTPDQLVLDMGVQVNGSSVAAALQQVSLAADQVTAALRAHGVTADEIQTSGLFIEPDYSSSSQLPDGYGASESLTATLVHIAAAGAQIQAAVRAGGNATTVDGISLNLTDTSGLLATARARAVADASAKAAQYARALGHRLGPVVSLSEQTQAPTLPVPLPAASAGRPASVPISPGSQQLSVSVTVVYALA